MRHDLYRVRSLDEAVPSLQRSASAESCDRAPVRRAQSEPALPPVAYADNLFGGLMRVQKKAAEKEAQEQERALAQQIAAQVHEAMERRAATGGGTFRNAKLGFTLTDSHSPRPDTLIPTPRDHPDELHA
eukprot:1509000-Rhodomonas_salina.1